MWGKENSIGRGVNVICLTKQYDTHDEVKFPSIRNCDFKVRDRSYDDIEAEANFIIMN